MLTHEAENQSSLGIPEKTGGRVPDGISQPRKKQIFLVKCGSENTLRKLLNNETTS